MLKFVVGIASGVFSAVIPKVSRNIIGRGAVAQIHCAVDEALSWPRRTDAQSWFHSERRLHWHGV